MINRESGQRILEGHTLAALGDLEIDTGAPEEALEHYQASLELRRQSGDVSGAGWMVLKLARVCSQRGSGDLAEEYLSEASRVAEETLDTELSDACEEMRTALDRGN